MKFTKIKSDIIESIKSVKSTDKKIRPTIKEEKEEKPQAVIPPANAMALADSAKNKKMAQDRIGEKEKEKKDFLAQSIKNMEKPVVKTDAMKKMKMVESFVTETFKDKFKVEENAIIVSTKSRADLKKLMEHARKSDIKFSISRINENYEFKFKLETLKEGLSYGEVFSIQEKAQEFIDKLGIENCIDNAEILHEFEEEAKEIGYYGQDLEDAIGAFEAYIQGEFDKLDESKKLKESMSSSEFLIWHEKGYKSDSKFNEKLEKVYEILSKYANEEDDVEKEYNKASEEERKEITKIISGKELKEEVEKSDDWNKLFAEWLSITEFALDKFEDGWGLKDLQGANLGDIEDDRFENAEQIIERMDIYVLDYIFADIEEMVDSDVLPKDFSFADIVAWYTDEMRQEYPDIAFDIKLCEMMAHHLKEVDLDKVFELMGGKTEESLKESVQSSKHKDIIGKHFEYSSDFEFLDIVASILDRIDFEAEDLENEIEESINDALIYTEDLWTIDKHYISSPADLDWETVLGEFRDDIFVLVNEIKG